MGAHWYYKKIYTPDGPCKLKLVATGVCQTCGKEFTGGNVSRSENCPECAQEVAKRKTRERQRRFRERQKEKKL